MSDTIRNVLKTKEVDGNEMLECPVCGFHYISISGVRVYGDPTDTGFEISKEGLKEINEGSGRRGSKISLSFECENGCNGTIELEFYKGNTIVTLHEYKIGEGVIWRN